VKTSTSALTGNEREKLEERVDQYDNSLDKIDEVTNVLDNYVGAAGVAGKATRTAEIVGNIFGSNDTDRVQMRRNIEYLQTTGTRLLQDANGRPLSSEAAKISDIIAGLNMGDTTANTLRSMQEIKQLYTKMRENEISRMDGSWKPRENNSLAIKPGANRQNPAKPASQADYDALPSGAWYQDDEGVKQKGNR
jgi:hypothetical protein